MRLKKYLTGGQVKLDKNKDGKITGEDFKLMRTKKKGMYAKGGMQMYAKDGAMVKALKKYANGGETDPVKKGGKRSAAMSERNEKLEEIKDNSKQMKLERALMQRVGFAKDRAKRQGLEDWSQGFTQEEMDLFRRIQKEGMTPDLKKTDPRFMK